MSNDQPLELPQFTWIDGVTLEVNTPYTRYEDMSPDGSLTLMIQKDGDCCIRVQQKNLHRLSSDSLKDFHIANIEFTMPMMGGGQSPRVRNALMYLAQAIQQDNDERPQYREGRNE